MQVQYNTLALHFIEQVRIQMRALMKKNTKQTNIRRAKSEFRSLELTMIQN